MIRSVGLEMFGMGWVAILQQLLTTMSSNALSPSKCENTRTPLFGLFGLKDGGFSRPGSYGYTHDAALAISPTSRDQLSNMVLLAAGPSAEMLRDVKPRNANSAKIKQESTGLYPL